MSKPLIVIPARMASSRLPGKPLAHISGVSMIRRTAQIADRISNVNYVVATDHVAVRDHCNKHGLPVVMTSTELATGSDRCLAAAEIFSPESEVIVNLQGDAPFTDPSYIKAILDRLMASGADIVTPAVQLSWDALDDFRRTKKSTPFSGTTVIESHGRAIWFSKTVMPAIRNEASLRDSGALSPILRHIGLYGFKYEAIKRFTTLAPSKYEYLEGLEQLRALENGMRIDIVKVEPPQIESSGIDSIEDILRAENLIKQFGDPFTV